MHYTLLYPYFLLLLPLSLCFVYCKKIVKKQYLPKLNWIPKRNRFFNFQIFLKILVFVLGVFALSHPVSYDAISPSQKYGIDIVLALDTSGSMRESGFSKKQEGKSKFEISKEIISLFIDKRVSDNIGIVVFGTFAFSASPVTYDHDGIKELLHMLSVEIAGKNTAIGEGIAQSIKTLSFGEAENRIIILLTDGINNSGSISVKQAVELARDKNIKIYTIRVGHVKAYGSPLLEKVSAQTGGKSFMAKNAKELENIYEDINKLYPSKIRSQQYLNKNTLFIYPLSLALFLLFWIVARRESKI